MRTSSLNRLGGVVLEDAMAAMAASCASTAPRPSAPGDAVLTLAAGQTSPIRGTPVRLRFDSVENDSRCPADVACIQAGDAVVRITAIAADRSGRRYELHTTGASSVVHDGLTIVLEALDPRPAGARPIRPADYRLTLRVRR